MLATNPMSVCLSVCLPIWLSVYLSVCLFVLSVCLSVSLSVSLFFSCSLSIGIYDFFPTARDAFIGILYAPLCTSKWNDCAYLSKHSHRSYKTKELRLTSFRRAIDLMVGFYLAYLSLPVVANLVSSSQVWRWEGKEKIEKNSYFWQYQNIIHV